MLKRSRLNTKKTIRVVKVIGITVASFFALTLLAFFVILRGIVPAVTCANHKISTSSGIDQLEMVDIGGIQQALYFRGQNTDNPVILFLHGGPATANIPFIHRFQYAWEEDFTVVNWDQRNTGKTFDANDPESVAKTLTVERALADAHEVTQYIKQKLGKDKVIVLGQSWGSILGTMLIQAYPEDYCMYIGVGQVINSKDNASVGYEKVLEVARAAGNQKDVDALMALAPYPPKDFDENTLKKIEVVNKYQVKYRLAFGMSLDTLMPVLTTPYYTIGEILSTIKGVVEAPEYQGDIYRFVWEEFDIRNYGCDYQIPVYYMHGENDWQTPYLLANAFFDDISAPDKRFFAIPNAGHEANIDNKDEFTRVLLEEIRRYWLCQVVCVNSEKDI
jgi:pimeloyl-ACP methyl ester carboxylesterase